MAKKQYAIYNADEELLMVGTSKECIKFLECEDRPNYFYDRVRQSKKEGAGGYGKCVIYIIDESGEDDE